MSRRGIHVSVPKLLSRLYTTSCMLLWLYCISGFIGNMYTVQYRQKTYRALGTSEGCLGVFLRFSYPLASLCSMPQILSQWNQIAFDSGETESGASLVLFPGSPEQDSYIIKLKTKTLLCKMLTCNTLPYPSFRAPPQPNTKTGVMWLWITKLYVLCLNTFYYTSNQPYILRAPHHSCTNEIMCSNVSKI